MIGNTANTAYDVDMLVNVIKWVVKYHHNASFSLMNITLQIIENSKPKIMSLLRQQKIGIDNQGFRIKILNNNQVIQQQTRIFEKLQKPQFLVKMWIKHQKRYNRGRQTLD